MRRHRGRAHGGRFPDTSRRPARAARASAPIRRRRSPRSRSTGRAAVVDGNVERVIARLEAIETPLPAAKTAIRAIVEQLAPQDAAGRFRAGDDGSRRHDLHAARPSCMLCPLNDDCAALRLGDPERFPVQGAEAERPQRVGAAFVAVRGDGAVLLRKRQDEGPARRHGRGSDHRLDGAPRRRDRRRRRALCRRLAARRPHRPRLHAFRPRSRGLPRRCRRAAAPAGPLVVGAAAIHGEALPTVMKKAIEAAIPGVTKRQGTE